MKFALKILLILAVAAFLVYSLMRIPGSTSEIQCTGIEVEINDSLKSGLVTKQDLETILQKSNISVEGKKISEINISKLQNTLCLNPYIDTAYASFNASGKLILTAIPRRPVLHVMPDSGEDYYLDSKGASMPIDSMNENLAIVTGKVSRELAETKLATLGRCILDSAFWKMQVQQIDVKEEYDVRMYTRVANHVIHLGSLDSIPDKLHRLRVFYQQGLPQTGWNKYESLSVEYQGMVVGTRKKKDKKTGY